MIDFLVVGLGTPTREHTNNRHSVGFLCLNKFAERHHGTWRTEHFGNLSVCNVPAFNSAETNNTEKMVLLLKPSVQMNDSGKSVSHLMIESRLSIEKMIVVHDDVDLPFGKVRIRLNGSTGGHGGIKSINSELKDAHYVRIKFGIGRPLREGDLSLLEFVLQDFQAHELETLPRLLQAVCDAIDCCVVFGMNTAMTRYNSLEFE